MTVKEFEIQNALGSLSYDMKVKLTVNPNTPKKILTILSEDKDWWIRYRVTMHSNTPIEILTKLSKDEDWFVKGNAVYTMKG